VVPILSQANSVKPRHSISLGSILISSSYQRIGLLGGLFPSYFHTKILHTFIFSPIRATCPAPLILLGDIILTILGEEYTHEALRYAVPPPSRHFTPPPQRPALNHPEPVCTDLALYVKKLETQLRGFSPRAKYTDRATAAKLVPTFADREVSRTQSDGSPTAVILVFYSENYT
jgi:hypothetical protein